MAYQSDANNAIVNGTSDATAVTRSTAGFKAPGQSAFVYTGMFNAIIASGASYTSTLLATLTTLNPTTGAIASAYISDFVLTASATSSANIDIRLQLGGVDLIRASAHSLAPIDLVNMETQPNAVAGSKTLNILTGSVASINQFWYLCNGWTE
jgi:hypothetical protein